MMSRNRIADLLRLLTNREGREAGEGDRKFLNLNRGEQGRLMQNIHRRFDCSTSREKLLVQEKSSLFCGTTVLQFQVFWVMLVGVLVEH